MVGDETDTYREVGLQPLNFRIARNLYTDRLPCVERLGVRERVPSLVEG
jgi:hypothetical protein